MPRRVISSLMKASKSAWTICISLVCVLGVHLANAAAAYSPTVAIDFSCAGYGGGGGAGLPTVRGVLLVHPTGGDDTALLQAALDQVAALPLDADGFRGAVQLASGTFRVAGQLMHGGDGVV